MTRDNETSRENYGSIADRDNLVTQSVDATSLVRDGKKRYSMQKFDYHHQKDQYENYKEFKETSAEIMLPARHNHMSFNSTYVIEPVAFIQNLATSIMGTNFVFYV